MSKEKDGKKKINPSLIVAVIIIIILLVALIYYAILPPKVEVIPSIITYHVTLPPKVEVVPTTIAMPTTIVQTVLKTITETKIETVLITQIITETSIIKLKPGFLRIVDAGWSVMEAKQGDMVTAYVTVEAVGGYFEGSVTVRIRKDMAFLPDEDHKVESFQLSLLEGKTQTVTVKFIAAEKSSMIFRGYFIEVEFPGGKWTMDDSYPPRLKVT
jgi:hypothetical protein